MKNQGEMLEWRDEEYTHILCINQCVSNVRLVSGTNMGLYELERNATHGTNACFKYHSFDIFGFGLLKHTLGIFRRVLGNLDPAGCSFQVRKMIYISMIRAP